MSEPHSPGQTAVGAAIPSQYQQIPDAWPAVDLPIPAKRRSGSLIVLVLVGVLLLCSGVAGTAIYVTTRQFGVGAPSPDEAVTAYLTGVYLHQEASEAESILCQQADPTALVTHKIKDAQTITNRYDAAYSWSALVVSDQTSSKVTVSTVLSAASTVYHATTNLSIETINSDGWWVCDVKSSSN